MAPNPKVAAAYRAMTVLGIQEIKVKPVLKKLLKLYDKNWELIEEENYRALADAIFEEEEKELQGKRKKCKNVDEGEMEDEEAQMQDEPVRPLKRLRLRGQESMASHSLSICGTSSAASPSKRPKVEDDTLPEGCSSQQPQCMAMASQSERNTETEVCPVPLRDSIVDKGKQPLLLQVAPRGRRLISERAPTVVPLKELTSERGIVPLQKNKMPHIHALIKPKDEPIDDLVDYDAPIATIHPEPPSGRDPPKQDGNGALVSKHRDEGRGEDIRDSSIEEPNHDIATSQQECSSTIEIASSASGEVKISMSCSSALGRSHFRLPSRDQLLKMMEDKCLRSYKITDPNFSVMKLLRDMCDCMLEFRTDSNDDSQEGSEMMTPSLNVLKESKACDALSVRANMEDLGTHSCTSNGSISVQCSAPLVASHISISPPLLSGMDDAVLVAKKVKTNDFPECDDGKGLEDPISPNSGSLVVVQQHQLSPGDLRSLHGVDDLSKGEENLRIPWVNETTNDFPPPFHYMHQSIGFREAFVNLYLSNIKCEDYCSTCLGNCLLSSTPCACTNKTGGGYAYTSQGLVKEEFLEECITISRNPQQHQFYCKYCPLEIAKMNDDCLEPCKGHLKRKFIKECWIKCGCVKKCGNRIVQQGITFNLQVFFTSEGKGWGLRTLEDMPKGAFVCEFVGEILTIKELYERNMQCAKNGTYTYPILLDAHWDSGVMKDKALCLDAAFYGNVARFINHRCLDANLIEIPVEVETPDHHYYHLAFFTSRKIAALEELTWDYGIDFDDNEGPVKPFSCRCGSKFCRKMKRSNRSNRSASIA